MAALIQRLELEATVFHCLIQLNMADTLTLHLNKQKQPIMISPHYGRLIWSGPGRCGFIFFYVSQPQYASQACVQMCTCVSVPVQTSRGSLGQRARSTACPLIAIYILAESLISNSPIICHTPILPPSLCLMLVSIFRAHQCHLTMESHINLSPVTEIVLFHKEMLETLWFVIVYQLLQWLRRA